MYYFRTEQKRIGKRRHKKSTKKKRGDDRFKTSFTSFDAFGCILDRWIDEVIVLGAKDTLRFVAKQLWFNYMKEAGVAYQDGNKEESTSKMPSYRDIQVAITGRRKLLYPGEIDRIKKAKLRIHKKQMIDETDDDDEDDIARKRRRKQRRKFLNTLNQSDITKDIDGDQNSIHGDDSEDSDDNCSISSTNSIYPSTPKSSSFYGEDSDSFGLSLSSFNTSYYSESQASVPVTEDDMSQSFHSNSGPSGSESDGSLDGTRNVEDRNIDVHIAVLDKVNTKHIFAQKNSGPRKEGLTNIMHPTLSRLFALFCLAVMLNEDNWITLSDLLYWADCGIISYKTSVLGIPPDMKLRGRADMAVFLPQGDFVPSSLYIKDLIYRLGVFINLGEVNLCASRKRTQILEILARYVRELSLPKSIVQSIEQKLSILALEGFKFHFKSVEEYNKTFNPKTRKKIVLPSLDVYCMALIIFVLKYDFGLDDRTEIHLSSIAMRENRILRQKDGVNTSTQKYFVFTDWLELSKRRAYLAVKYCYHLHKRYSLSLIPEVERSLPCMVRFIEEVSNRAELIKSHLSGSSCNTNEEATSDLDGQYSSDHSSSNPTSEYSSTSKGGNEVSESHRDILNVANFIRKELCPEMLDDHNSSDDKESKNFKVAIKNTLDLSVSDTPLHDFSVKQIEFNNHTTKKYLSEEKIRLDDAKKIEILLDMHDQQVLGPSNVLKSDDKYEDIFKIMDNDPKDFMLSEIELANSNKIVTSKAHYYITAENPLNSTKTILTSGESRLPVPNLNSDIDPKDLFLSRKYWMSHHIRVRKMLDKDGCPMPIHSGVFR